MDRLDDRDKLMVNTDLRRCNPAHRIFRLSPAIELLRRLCLGLVLLIYAEPTIAAEQTATVFSLRVGEQAVFAPDSIAVLFESVTEDSRCPADATCITEGNAAVQLTVGRGDADVTSVTLNSSARHFARQVDVMGYRLRLVALHPAPRTDYWPTAEAYVLTLSLEPIAVPGEAAPVEPEPTDTG